VLGARDGRGGSGGRGRFCGGTEREPRRGCSGSVGVEEASEAAGGREGVVSDVMAAGEAGRRGGGERTGALTANAAGPEEAAASECGGSERGVPVLPRSSWATNRDGKACSGHGGEGYSPPWGDSEGGAVEACRAALPRLVGVAGAEAESCTVLLAGAPALCCATPRRRGGAASGARLTSSLLPCGSRVLSAQYAVTVGDALGTGCRHGSWGMGVDAP